MGSLHIKTKAGLVSVTAAKLRDLIVAGKIPPEAKVVSCDGGISWITAFDALARPLDNPAPPSVPADREVARNQLADPEKVPGLIVAAYILSGLSLLMACFTSIPAVICAYIAYNNPNSRTKAKTALKVSIASFVITSIGFVILGNFTEKREGETHQSSSTQTRSTAPASPNNLDPDPPAASAASAGESQTQRAFVELIDRFYMQFREATTDLQRNIARRERCSAIDQLSPNAMNWLGTVEDISTGMFAGGKAELTVRIAKNITVTTGPLGETLISRDSPIFASLAKMKNGTRIRFSGKFLRNPKDGFEELSLTEKGSMKAPAFTMKFDAIEPLD